MWKRNRIKYINFVSVSTNNQNVEPDLKQRYAKINMLRLMVIIDYLKTTLFYREYAKVDNNYLRLPYDNYNTPQAQSTAGYGIA